MNNVIKIEIYQFLLVYLLLLIIIFILKKCRINKTKTLILTSFKMTVQLILAGLILTLLFEKPNPVFTLLYILIMIGFSIYRVLSKNKNLNKKFKFIIGLSIFCSGTFVIIYFIKIVVGENIFNPQYIIPISGMLMGNTMNGVSLGIKTFNESIKGKQKYINAMLCAGAKPSKILFPFVTQALETSMLPTLNSMAGMGIVSLPGMMTGQILAGTLPTTAILYQISIMIAICTVVTTASFCALFFGYRTLYDRKTQIINLSSDNQTLNISKS